jgi:hypothetical protein
MDQNSLGFLRDSLSHHHNLRSGLDSKASFLVGVAGVIFGLSVNHLKELNFLVLAICSFIAFFLSILAVFLPFRGKIKERFSLMCWWGFTDKDLRQYEDELRKVFDSEEKIIQEYMREIWNVVNYSIKPKTLILKWASFVLILGLLAGFVLFFV